MSDDSINRFLDDVQDVAELGKATIEGGIDARAVLALYLIHCREILITVRLLGGVGLGRRVDPLVRSALEFAATGGWLMASPIENFQILRSAMNYQLRLAIDEYERQHGPIEIAGVDLPGIRAQARQPFPSMPDRTRVAGMERWYAAYRMLSTTSHGTLAGAFHGGQVRHQGQMVDTTAYKSSLLLVAAMTLTLAELASRTFSWGREDVIKELVMRFNELAESSEGLGALILKANLTRSPPET